MPTLIAYVSSTPGTHDALPDKVPVAEPVESVAMGPTPSLNCHQCAGVRVGAGDCVAFGVGVGVEVVVLVGVGLWAGVGVELYVGVAVGVRVGVGTMAVTLASVESALSPAPLGPPV